MERYVLSTKAESDLNEIWDYTEQQWNRAQAERYLTEIQQAMEMLVEHPHLGRRCDDIKFEYNKLAVGSHVIFYKIGAIEIDVIRILHQRMDFQRRL